MPFVLALILTLSHLWVHPLPPIKPLVIPIIPTPTLAPNVSRPQSGEVEWGVAQKIGEHTYSIRVQNDAVMATPDEIPPAINDLRARSAAQPLKSDSRLCQYAGIR